MEPVRRIIATLFITIGAFVLLTGAVGRPFWAALVGLLLPAWLVLDAIRGRGAP